MLVFIDRALGVVSAARVWFLTQPLPIPIVVGAAELAMLWFRWTILRVTLVAFRAALREPLAHVRSLVGPMLAGDGRSRQPTR